MTKSSNRSSEGLKPVWAYVAAAIMIFVIGAWILGSDDNSERHAARDTTPATEGSMK